LVIPKSRPGLKSWLKEAEECTWLFGSALALVNSNAARAAFILKGDLNVSTPLRHNHFGIRVAAYPFTVRHRALIFRFRPTDDIVDLECSLIIEIGVERPSSSDSGENDGDNNFRFLAARFCVQPIHFIP
jgi:hypothetical protein